MKQIQIGILGAGRIGQLHAKNITKYLPQFKIKCIADTEIDKNWAQSLEIPTANHIETIIEDKNIQAILICTPSILHTNHIIEAAQAGKHIFCEKPIGTDIKQIKQALHEVKKAGVKLQIGFNRRFDPNFARIKQLVTDDYIGNPHLLRITSRDPKIPPAEFIKSSGGMLVDMTIHDFDMARFLMNSEIREIYASTSVLISPIFNEYNDIDTAVINLKFANNTIGVIDNSRQAVYGYDQRIEILGSHGAVHADNNKLTNTILSTAQGIVSEKPLYFFLERYHESFINELAAFHACIMNDTSPPVTGEDGLHSVIVSMAAEQSYKENRPININYNI